MMNLLLLVSSLGFSVAVTPTAAPAQTTTPPTPHPNPFKVQHFAPQQLWDQFSNSHGNNFTPNPADFPINALIPKAGSVVNGVPVQTQPPSPNPIATQTTGVPAAQGSTHTPLFPASYYPSTGPATNDYAFSEMFRFGNTYDNQLFNKVDNNNKYNYNVPAGQQSPPNNNLFGSYSAPAWPSSYSWPNAYTWNTNSYNNWNSAVNNFNYNSYAGASYTPANNWNALASAAVQAAQATWAAPTYNQFSAYNPVPAYNSYNWNSGTNYWG